MSSAVLDVTGRKARYGAAYIRTIASQAGCSFTETSIDEDKLAIDGTVGFAAGDVRFQVKCTSSRTIVDKPLAIRMPIRPDWVRKWAQSVTMPIFFVVVVVPSDSLQWLAHDTSGTMMSKTAAFWLRIPPNGLGAAKSLLVPRAQRLSESSMLSWNDVLIGEYSRGGV